MFSPFSFFLPFFFPNYFSRGGTYLHVGTSQTRTNDGDTVKSLPSPLVPTRALLLTSLSVLDASFYSSTFCLLLGSLSNMSTSNSLQISFSHLATQANSMSNMLTLGLTRLLHDNRIGYNLLCHSHSLHKHLTTHQRHHFYHNFCTI
jgi:hypothetical protein